MPFTLLISGVNYIYHFHPFFLMYLLPIECCCFSGNYRAVFSVADYFQLNDIAHNVFITRGTLFGEDKDSANTTVRVYLWPRKHYIGNTKLSDV